MLTQIKKIVSPTNPIRLAWHFVWDLAATIFYRFPSRSITVIGVTGTNGKTTTANLIAKILETNGEKVALATTINFWLGEKKWDNITKMTSLGRGGVQRFLRQAVNAGCNYAVLEVSSHALIQHRVWGVNFNAAILTNITHEHLDFHGSFEEYIAAKELLFWRLAKNRESGEKIAILPAEDTSIEHFLRIPEIGIISFGFKKGDLRAENLRVRESSQKFEVIGMEEKFEITTKLLGNFNVSNILAATALALALKIRPKIIRQVFRNLKPLPGRLEAIDGGQNFRVIVDFAHTPDALEKLLRTFRAVTEGRVWLVFGATGDRDRAKRPVMGSIAAKLADEIILTSDDPFSEDPEKIIFEVREGIPRTEGENFLVEVDRRKAIRYACENAQKEDTVLIAGKGCEQFQVIGNKKIPWDDREISRKFLEKRFAKLRRK
ncbi:UDP-N-acetylmuramoyl-L-alanyl-D-glutamate--2,6-diaminopimelate ligase [Candidatus Gracilibacteria bacterium]|nr:UDP-N-acetylmuramoyl-L-alanyl-D-glutamate--2,6-diaminopimelate ligase [Candidatus Gracilibacteria bacterium]MCF7856357.1 UDP-N-acetylmuramoyl-L-alanyl-D-glutamate--2,6-diaminopimelate ligase [Candidatus Gracilibacteria bacterium]MCF7896746.1 UDP-N-acetylmuramoyl-L-alanyl-D-glutamate--2,6-diaminopimelate ligase [Candidatus Gracilibacteria bacterium]